MKILCETQLINRQIPQNRIVNRFNKSTIAIAFHPPNVSNSEIFLIHFTSQNKQGCRYKIKNNIEKIFMKFINDGKTTISFKIPEHDLQIKCDSIQLKCFLRAIKLALEGNKDELNKIGLKATTLCVTPVSQKSIPPTKLTITKASDYPVKGLPKSLKELQISLMNCHRVDSQILKLKNLTKLNLSDNIIRFIPKQLGEIGLKELIISSNQLGKEDEDDNFSNFKQKWEWLNGKCIRETLQLLDLSKNQLKYFPYNLVKLDNLITLNLNNNEIKRIPFAIRRLSKLRFLHLNANKLESIPHTIMYVSLHTLNLCDNNFQPLNHSNLSEESSNTNQSQVQPLWILAGQVIRKKRIPYSESTIPSTLVDFLSELPLCYCGRLFFFNNDTPFRRYPNFVLNNALRSHSSDRSGKYTDVIFCSKKCLKNNVYGYF